MRELYGDRVTPRKDRVYALGIGVVAGFASGLLGVGGGLVMVPMLVAALGATQREAHATSLAAILPIAAIGLIPFALEGAVDVPVALLLAAGSLVGSRLGAHLLVRTHDRVLQALFGLLSIGAGIALVLR